MAHTSFELFDKDPYLGWTHEAIKQHLEENPLSKGDLVVIANPHAGIYEYRLTSVENPGYGRQKRIILSHSGDYGGKTFYRSGKNTWAPTGQTRMIPFDERLKAFLKEPGDTAMANALYGVPTNSIRAPETVE